MKFDTVDMLFQQRSSFNSTSLMGMSLKRTLPLIQNLTGFLFSTFKV